MNTKSKVTRTRPTSFDPATYEKFVREVRELLGRGHLGDENLREMFRDPNWFSCWNEGLSPEASVAAFRSVMN